MVGGGARLIQLRDKQASSARFFREAAECMAYAREHGVRVIINDRVDIARIVGADGVHLGQDDLPAQEARRILGPDSIIGLSTHSLAQAREAQRDPVDYIAIGPVFGTATKSDPDPEVGIIGVEAVRSVIGDMILVAIGGIEESNISAVLQAGANSAAIIGGILRNPEAITERTAKLIQTAV